MTVYDWVMACGAIVIVVFVVKAFWRADKIDAVDQSDNPPPGAGLPPGA